MANAGRAERSSARSGGQKRASSSSAALAGQSSKSQQPRDAAPLQGPVADQAMPLSRKAVASAPSRANKTVTVDEEYKYTQNHWRHLVQKEKLGAHYDYVVGEMHRCTDNEYRSAHNGHGARECIAPHAESMFKVSDDEDDNPCKDSDARQQVAAGIPMVIFDARQDGCVGRDDEELRSRIKRKNTMAKCDQHRKSQFKKFGEALGTTAEAQDRVHGKVAEAEFRKQMGHKATDPQRNPEQPMMRHRGVKEDDGPAAGPRSKEKGRAKKRQDFPGLAGDAVPRSGVAMVLSAQAEDPPAPSRVTAVSKAVAEFSHGHSHEATRHSVHQNQEMYRFAAEPMRSKSVPPQTVFKDCAGVSSAESNSRWPAASYYRPPECSGKKKKSAHASSGSSVASLMDAEAMHREVEEDRNQRSQNDRIFAQLCAFTEHSKKAMIETRNALKTLGRRPTSVGNQMIWDTE